MTSADADIVILGGGCAGLSLARRLATARCKARVIVVEPRSAYTDDRSWCFWAPSHDHAESHLVAQSWKQWRFSTLSGQTQTHEHPGMRYHYIRSQDFYDDACARIASHDAIEMKMGVRAQDVRRDSERYLVETDQGVLSTNAVVDTRSLPGESPALLYQCFLGLEIAHPPLRPEQAHVAGLMEAMDCDRDGFHFLYVLPLGSERSLIEVTRFAQDRIDPETLRGQLDDQIIRLHGAATQCLRTESGVLPMGLTHAIPATSGPQHVYAGLAGGALRPASGYAFQRIQHWAEACTVSILSDRGVIGHPPEPMIRGLMDQVFLHALRAEPRRGADFFMALAKRLSPDAFVRFMSDTATFGDKVSVISALPPAPFLKAVWTSVQDHKSAA